MNEVARDSFEYDKFPTIFRILLDAITTKRPAAWRIIFKGLNLLEHLVKNGSERCVDTARQHLHTVKSLYNFNYYEGTVDRGVGVREKSKQVVEMLGDDDMIREERTKAKKLREKFAGNNFGDSGMGGGGSSRRERDDNDYNGGGGGYGESGIGSSRNNNSGNAFSDSNNDNNRGYSGRYDSNDTNSAGNDTSAPTFASVPEKKEKKEKKTKSTKIKKLKKKKVEERVEAPAVSSGK